MGDLYVIQQSNEQADQQYAVEYLKIQARGLIT